MRDLAAETAGFLVGRAAGATVEEIARGIRARTADVRRTLACDNRFSGPHAQLAARPTRNLYLLREAAGTGGDGSTRPVTQNERVLRALRDGEWHTTTDIHRLIGTCRLNSRVAELRSRGYLIEHRGGGPGPDAHEYRLTTLDESATANHPAASALSSSGVGQSSLPVETQLAPLQLELAGVS